MAAVINRTTLVYLPSVNTPDYPEPTWRANPDMSQVAGVLERYWKWDEATDRPVPMSGAEQAAVDAAIAAANAAATEDAQTAMFPGLAKGDMAVFNGSKIKRLPVGADDEMLVPDSTTSLGVKWSRARWVPIAKQANESRVNTTTLASDNTLSFAVAANTLYAFRGSVFFETTAAADFKWSFAGPGATVRIQRATIAAGATAWGNVGVATSWSFSVAVTGTGTSGGYVHFDGIADVGASPGTIAFQWAQNTADAGATIVTRGSWLEWARVG